MDYKDYYKFLGVERTAEQKEIKRAYRKLARKFHPDVNTDAGAEEKFKEISEAFAVIGDEEQRAAYDQLWAKPPSGQGFRAPPNWNESYSFSSSDPHMDQAGFSDFFETMFRSGQTPRDFSSQFRDKGQDQHARIALDITDAFGGSTRMLSLQLPEIDAAGRVSFKERTISVNIPKGILAGQHIRLKGKGQSRLDSTQFSDLLLEVTFASHPVYRVDGRDIFLDLPITPWEAALGGRIEMPTPSGKVDVKIPKNARSGQKLRLKGRGIPATPPGDMFAILIIVNPPIKSEKEHEYFEQMAREMSFDPRANMKG